MWENNVSPIRHQSETTDPVARWAEALIDGDIEPDDLPGPLMRLVLGYLATAVRTARQTD